jgi:hypothetical protein
MKRLAMTWKVLPPYQPVCINVQAVDAWFKNRTFKYLGLGEEDGEGRRRKCIEYMRDKKTVKVAPSIRIAPGDGLDTDQVIFRDGRHRFCIMRDLGVKKMIVGMGELSKEFAEKYGLIAEK